MKQRFSSLLVAGGFIAGSVFGSAAGALGATVLGSSYFDDVPTGSYYDKAVGEMYSDGVIKGNPDGTFRPGDFVTRADVAVMFQRFRDSLDGTTTVRSSSSRSSASSTSSTSSQSTTASSYSYNPKGTVRFTTNAFSANETIGNYTVTVVRTGGGDGSTTVNYAVTAGSATAGSDFDIVSGTLSFANKETSKTFTVKILDDSTSEGNETATMTLSNVTNGVSLGSPSTATLTILDNESSSSSNSSAGGGVASSSSSNPNGTFSFAASGYGVRENAGTATITVNRAGGTNGSVSVNYATANGTGTSGTDYAATSGTLTFAAGETSKSFTVSITDDSSVDGAKSFTVTLSSPTSGSNIGNGSTTVTIYDNDDSTVFGSGSLKLAKATYTVLESDKKVDIVVQRTGGTLGTATVEYRTTNGMAFSGNDYTHITGTLTFQPGESAKIISVPIVDDSTNEDEEAFNFDIFNVVNATLISPLSASITISD
jgi:hypothetical protein